MSDLSPAASAEIPTTDAQASAAAERPASSKRATKGDTTDLGLRFDDSTPGVQTVHMSRNDIICALFHTKDSAQASNFLAQCLTSVRTDEAGQGNGILDNRIFMVSVVRDLAPRDVVERMLAVQMASTHVAMVRAAKLLASSSQIPQLEANSTNYNKLARTFAAQMEALRKHRNGGKQTVVVQHVNVAEGGQAIVGDVHHGGRGARDEA